MQIPTNRKVTWRDVEALREHFGFTRSKWFELLGLPPNRWAAIEKNHLDDEVVDVAYAQLVRLYDERPDLIPVPVATDMRKMFERLQQQAGTTIKPRHFGPLFGRNSCAGYAWLKGKDAAPAVLRLAEAIKKLPDGYDVLKRLNAIEEAVRDAEPFRTGHWRDKNE